MVQAPFEEISTGGQKYLMQPDGSFLAAGLRPDQAHGQVDREGRPAQDHRLPAGAAERPEPAADGPGRSFKGTCALTEFEVEAAPADATRRRRRRRSSSPGRRPTSSSRSAPGAELRRPTNRKRIVGPVAFAIDGKDETAWGIDAGPGRRNVPRKAVFVAETPVERRGGTELTFVLAQNHGGWNSDDLQTNNLGRFRLSVTDAPDPTPTRCPRGVREILAIPRERAHAGADRRGLRATGGRPSPSGRRPTTGSRPSGSGHPAGTTHARPPGHATEPRTTQPPQARRLPQAGQAGRAGVPGVPPPAARRRPADAPDLRPLARRPPRRRRPPGSFVNRVWQAYFGTGLVATTEDLGTQSEAPSHPELLDWLAVEFMDRGWSLKELHRLIVTSATYRQSCKVTPELLREDPYNRLLARGRAAPGRGRDRPRHPARGERPAQPDGRRAERDAAGAGVPVPAAGQLRAVPVDRGDRPGPLPPRPLHLPPPLDALPDAPDLRRARRRRPPASAGPGRTRRSRP